MDWKIAIRAFAGLALLLACASTPDNAGLMARLYPLGQPPPPDSIEIRFVRKLPIDQLASRYPERAFESVGTMDASKATEFYQYDASNPRGVGVGMHVNRQCDFVLVDSEGLVIGAFRVEEIC